MSSPCPRGETPRKDEIAVDELEDLGPKTAENLVQAGFETVQDVVKASIEDLINVPGVGDVSAQKIYLAAVQHLEKVEEERAAAEAAAAEPAEELVIEPPKDEVEDAPAEESAAEEESAEAEAESLEEEAAPEPAEEKPEPAAPVAPAAAPKGEAGKNENYLDDIEAMESELTAGWDEADGDKGGAKQAPSEGDSARS